MGVLTYFVVADRAAAQRVGESPPLIEELGGIDAKGVIQLHMEKLCAVLGGTARDADSLTSEETCLYSGSEYGPWVVLVPQDMTSRLARVQDHYVSELANAWVKTDRFDPLYSDWRRPDVERVIRDLAALSRRAVAEEKSLLMWTSM